MWPRTRLKIGWGDLAYGLYRCISRPEPERLEGRIGAFFSDRGEAVVCFSVRSGFDLLLQALDPPRGSHILFSALNIKGMIRIVERRGLVPVPIDLDLDRMAPRLDALERAVSPQARAIVVAHLFGARLDLDPVIALARRHGLLVVEDCAQAFDGRAYRGHPDADISLFSFGPLKTGTALGAGVAVVRNPDLRARMVAIQAGYPVQATGAYAKRLAKFAALKLATTPVIFGALFRLFHLLGKDYEDPVSDAVRGVAKLGSDRQVRKRPCPALLAVLDRRLATWREGSLGETARLGDRLRRLLGAGVVCPAEGNAVRNYWVFPVLTAEPMRLIRALRAAGFDGANLPRSRAVEAPADRPDLDPVTAREALSHLVVLPCYPGMSEQDLERQAEIVRREAAPPQALFAAAPAAAE